MSLSAHSSLYSRTGTPGGLGRWHDASQNSAQRGGLPRIPAWRVGVLHPSDLCDTLVRGERSFELFPIFFRPLVSLPHLTSHQPGSESPNPRRPVERGPRPAYSLAGTPRATRRQPQKLTGTFWVRHPPFPPCPPPPPHL